MVNARQKGGDGERQVADDLNTILYLVRQELGLPTPSQPQVQRNQNQSAVGGCDLVGTYEFAIEVKRQEQLSINTWWEQCVASARPTKAIPVLLFRQNNKAWRCIMQAQVPFGQEQAVHNVRAEIPYEDFKKMFRLTALRTLARASSHGDVFAAS